MKYLTLLIVCLVTLMSCGDSDKSKDLTANIEQNSQKSNSSALNYDGKLEKENITLSLKKYHDQVTIIFEPITYHKAIYRFKRELMPAHAFRGRNFSGVDCNIDEYEYIDTQMETDINEALYRKHVNFILIDGKSLSEFKNKKISISNGFISIVIKSNSLVTQELTLTNPTLKNASQFIYDLAPCSSHYTHPNYKNVGTTSGPSKTTEYVTFRYQII